MKKADKIEIYNASTGKIEKVDVVLKTDEEWKKILTPEQFEVMRRKGTERPFSKQCSITKSGKGIYQCAACGTDLFAYGEKFESGTGWPSFWDPVSPLNLKIEEDSSFGMHRSEVLCARCGSHLGHVFDDGPPPTGKRYCINTVSLKLKEAAQVAPGAEFKKATFAAGCFWGVEKILAELPGVVSTRVGYSGGRTQDPTYEEVCSGATGHAEAVEIMYNPSKISYEELLVNFWQYHDPTTKNRQGPDIGSQYRSVVFYHDQEQKKAAEKSRDTLGKARIFKTSIVTEIVPAQEFYSAEEYHQKYLKKNPKGYCSHHLQSDRIAKALRSTSG